MVDGVTYLPLPAAKPQSDRASADRCGARLRSFIVDDANAHALHAVDALLGTPSAPPPIILLHGPSGVGKTHLANALARSWQASHHDARVVATTGADFARQWDTPSRDDSTGIDNHDLHDVGNNVNDANNNRASTKPRNAAWNMIALFVLDNVDDLADKPAAQRELCVALDQITASCGRAILTSRRNPARDAQLSPALASRLASGLVVSLAKLGKPGRAAVVAEIALARGLSLSVESIERIAASSASTVPELAGLIVQLDMTARAEHHPVDETFIRGHVVASEVAVPTVPAIAQHTAKHFAAKLAELRGPGRRKELVAARSVAIYLARELTSESLQSIGRYFGNRDHATIAYNIEKVASELAAGEASTCQAIARIREAVNAIT